jgi:hypothetical protein
MPVAVVATTAAAGNFGGWLKRMAVVFIHYPYSNPHPPQMGRV